MLVEEFAYSAMLYWGDVQVSIPTTHKGTSIIRNRLPLGPYSRPMPRALWWS